APFRALAKPLVVGADSKIIVSLVKGKDWVLAIDGQYERRLKPEDKVTVSISDKQARFLRLK
ncbi:MAG: NAD(+) kinase, partial [Candidatus Thermoplasmatota archaeon]